jgi:hypothetical protein
VKWVTREGAKVDCIACPWLIRSFVDGEAEFLLVPADRVGEVARTEGAIPFDPEGVELRHYEEGGDVRCTFDAIMRKYGLEDPALLDMAEFVRRADVRSRGMRAGGGAGGPRPRLPDHRQ